MRCKKERKKKKEHLIRQLSRKGGSSIATFSRWRRLYFSSLKRKELLIKKRIGSSYDKPMR